MSLRSAEAFSAAKQSPNDREISLNGRLLTCTAPNAVRCMCRHNPPRNDIVSVTNLPLKRPAPGGGTRCRHSPKEETERAFDCPLSFTILLLCTNYHKVILSLIGSDKIHDYYLRFRSSSKPDVMRGLGGCRRAFPPARRLSNSVLKDIQSSTIKMKCEVLS